MVRGETISYRLLPAGQIYVVTGLFLVGAMVTMPAIAAPALVLWLTIGALQLWWPRLAVRRVEVRFLPPPRASRAGQPCFLSVQVRNTSAWLRLGPVFLQPSLTGRVTALPPHAMVEPLLPGASRVERLDFGVMSRGRHLAECDAISTLRPFALTIATKPIRHEVAPLIVWCARIDSPMTMPAIHRRTRGRPSRHALHARSHEEHSHLRPYRVGDPMRTIQWRVSARAGELLVMERQSRPAPRVWLCVETVGIRWPESVQFERMLRMASTIIEDQFRLGNLCGIVLNNHTRRITDRHSLGVVLDTLASLRNSSGPSTGPERGRSRKGQTYRLEILQLLPGPAHRVRLADAGGRILTEI